MPSSHTTCNIELLQQSLGDQLSQASEEWLAAHLTECPDCRVRLEHLAADASNWQQIESALKSEIRHKLPGGPGPGSTLIPASAIGRDADDLTESPGFRPSDFIVDFLQPSEDPESLGRLGPIEIRQFIGQGAHGIVLKGFQQELNRPVVVKVMAPHLASVVAARKRFAREARATAAIVHPSVMPILQVDSSGQLPFLVMPYVDCESLQERMDRDGALPVSDVLRIAVQVARGLAAAHAQGLVHRDVKPANILLERGVERVMLTDFGLARAVDDATLTRSGLIAGTPHYMSPEQARGEPVDTRSDLFSLGSVMYAMSSGRPPFRAETTYGILRRVTDDAPRSLRELNPELPEWLDAIILKLLTKSAAERLQTAEHSAELLEQCLAHLQQPDISQLPEMLRSVKEHPRVLPFRMAGLLVTLAAVALLITAGMMMTNTPPSNDVASQDKTKSNGSTATSAETAVAVASPESALLPESQRQVSTVTVLQPFTPPDSDLLLPTTPEPPAWDDGLEQQLEELNNELDVLFETTDSTESPSPK
jgi:serine/threonine protein kinase